MPSPHKRATLRDVAARAGVSTAQASFALNGSGRVAPGTAERIRRAAAELDYQADSRARALRTGQRSAYGVVIRNMRNPYFLDVLRGMEVTAHEHDALLLIMSSDYDPEREAAALRRFTAEGVGGIAIAPIGRGGPLSDWRSRNPAIPVVAFNCTPDPDLSAGQGALPVPTVGPDDGAAIALALGHLKEYGHRRATLVVAPKERVADWGREEEFERLCGVWAMEGTVLRCPLDYRGVARVAGERIAASPRHQAFVVNSDHLGAAVYDAAHALGLRVGRDVSVVGHDDLPTSRLLDPGMTTVRFDRERLGEHVMGLLLAPQEKSLSLPVELVVRDSVARLAQ
ncbi:LacI family DNA-binding transcriptional regulator [Nocardiopsis ansamitocini]|uniref:LacI family transcriptional regulator n=1 Tax=Nocardiopsis ansamitocini TaxID=1670832 RepID=A0A9W6ULM5_9ACTN|nr:LacI family DNA-binding transcriptional regulator [Nocardiopsis ansamitocini]GLU50225.1 LacI family transcriptional regulator [Nocardiopsis ansamitocini]